MELPVIAIVQNNITLYVGTMNAKTLTNEKLIKIDTYSAKTDTGYQRKPSMSRARDFARYLKNAQGISPTSILLNMRGELGDFKPISSSFGIITIPDNTNFWVVDGQHRIEGLRELVSSNPNYADFPCIVVFMCANSEYEEAKQFLILNQTQKGIKSDLAERFIVRMAKREGVKELINMPRAIIKDIEWTARALSIVDILNSKKSEDPNDDFYNNPWYQRIQLPNDMKKGTSVSQSAFNNSLKSILENPSLSGYGDEELSVILVRYWSAILAICPNAKSQPKDFVIQRSTGVAVMHKVLPRVLSFVKLRGDRLSIEEIKGVLGKMKDGMNEMYWSKDGIAGIVGTSKKAISILTTKFLEFLEESNVQNAEALKKPFEL